jgi:hypothetical protein
MALTCPNSLNKQALYISKVLQYGIIPGYRHNPRDFTTIINVFDAKYGFHHPFTLQRIAHADLIRYYSA